LIGINLDDTSTVDSAGRFILRMTCPLADYSCSSAPSPGPARTARTWRKRT